MAALNPTLFNWEWHMPCGHKGGGRNLIVCIDGTANQFGDMNTNVIELYNLILKESPDNQCTWYNSGIGTYAQPRLMSLDYWLQIVWHLVDMAIAWDFDKTVLAAYEWLSDNYQDGDRIFLFGFSRGAFQVRTLSGMVDRVGLIHKGNKMQIPFAYKLYRDSDNDHETAAPVGSNQEPGKNAPPDRWMSIILVSIAVGLMKAVSFLFGRWAPKRQDPVKHQQPVSGGSTQVYVSKAERFKRAFSRKDVRVHFVGAWDTVSSIGIARGKKMLPRTTDGMTHVCYFRHALALDERRVKFLPEYAWGGSTIPPSQHSDWKHTPPSSEVEKTRSSDIHTLEVWFAGTHSDIGGGNAQNLGMDRSRPPLRWMVLEAVALGLRTAKFERELTSEQQIEFQESLTGIWHLLEYCPIQRLTFDWKPEGKTMTRTPHRGRSRKIHWGQKIHSSLVLAKTPYKPKACPPPDIGLPQPGDLSFWDQLRADGLANSTGWLEIDIFDHATARGIIRMFIAGEVEVAEYVRRIVAQDKGFLGPPGQDSYNEVMSGLMRWGGQQPTVEVKCQLLGHIIDIFKYQSPKLQLIPLLRVRHSLGDLRESNRYDYKAVADAFLRQLTDGSRPLVLSGHTDFVWSVAFSPDSKRIVSGSKDTMIRIWNPNTGAQIREPLQGHMGPLSSVVVSPHGKRVVSSSEDGTIRIWDLETGKQMGAPLGGHSGLVKCVVISPDGKRIVSGSYDNTIRIWDAETGTQVGEPLQGHTENVQSVAISPDGKRIVSGSNDKTIRIWDAETGAQVGEPLQGHTEWVMSVAISPDGERIVSGSADHTIRIWDVETGAQLGEPLQGHTYWVYSVVISPDGKRIISGSGDGTIRIWDVETGMPVGEPLRGHTGQVLSVTVSPDGKSIVSGSTDKSIRIWNAEGILA